MVENKLVEQIEKHLLNDDKPSVYLNELKINGMLDKYPFSQLKKLETINQAPKHHPEGNVWNHTMMVVDEGAKYKEKANDKRAVMWALLLHDIGKIKTTKLRNGRLTSYDHDRIGQKDAREFLECIMNDNEFINKVVNLVRYHMHMLYMTNNLPFGDMEGMKKYNNTDDLAVVFLSDRLGRGGLNEEEKRKIKKQVENFKNEI
ncbi:MAG: HD domain-containing protein [Clostridiaceae bacterium]|nr:HD domain-containing protein [Clostridiaceae bacterium]